jgi:hypothetical protein
MPRRLTPPTLSQGGGQQQWSVRHTTRRPGPWPAKHRHDRCLRCGVSLLTEARPAIPWSEQDLVTRLRARRPAGPPVSLRDLGITARPLSGLNALLGPQGFFMHAAKVRAPTRFVAGTDSADRLEPCGLFERRPISQGT